MNHNDQYKVIGHISPGGMGGNQTATVSSVIDTVGYAGGRLIITVGLGAMVAAAAKLFVSESDDNSTFAQVIGQTSTDVDGNAGVAVDANDDNTDVVFDIHLNATRKRYFTVNFTTSAVVGKSQVSVHAIIIGKNLGVAQSTASLTQRTGSKAYRASNA